MNKVYTTKKGEIMRKTKTNTFDVNLKHINLSNTIFKLNNTNQLVINNQGML